MRPGSLAFDVLSSLSFISFPGRGGGDKEASNSPASILTATFTPKATPVTTAAGTVQKIKGHTALEQAGVYGWSVGRPNICQQFRKECSS